MPTRDDIIAAIRQQLEAVRAARLEEIRAAQPRVMVHHEPVDYARIARLLVDALTALAPGVIEQSVTEVATEMARRHAQGYPPVHHRHRWQEIDDKPGEYPPAPHTHRELREAVDDVRRYADGISRHVEHLATNPVMWEHVLGKPTSFRPVPHEHPLPDEMVRLLDLLYEQGKPGQVLMRTRSGLEWRDVPTRIVYQYIGGGSGAEETIAGIVDSAGAYIVDSSGTYVEAV